MELSSSKAELILCGLDCYKKMVNPSEDELEEIDELENLFEEMRGEN